MSKSLQGSLEKLKMARKSDIKVVLVTGVFDVLHQEHTRFLQKAKLQGEYLLVGLESDKRVREMKGPQRPINSQQVRLKNIISLQIANDAFILPEQFSGPADHEQLIETIKPNILAVSSHTNHSKEKTKIIEKYGGKLVVVHEHNPQFSSTIAINQEKK